MSAAAELDARLTNLLLGALRKQWAYQSWARFGDRLRSPSFTLSDSERVLGCWVSGDREMRFSRRLVLEVPWVHVEEILLHEMAHQYVDEVLGVRDEPPHGPTFREVCRQRGIDPAATSPLEGGGAGEDPRTVRLRDKVRKLLALAGSDNPHEAELAMVRARELLTKHELELGLEGAERGYAVRRLGRGRRRREAWEAGIGSLLQLHFGVQVIQVDDYDPRGGCDVKALEIIGTPANVEMAEYVWSFLVRTVEAIWRSRQGQLGGRRRSAFLRGVVRGFREKLDAQTDAWTPADADAATEAAAIVLREEARLDAYVRQRFPRLHTASSSRTSHAGAFHAGREDGRRIVLHRPITGSGSGGGLLPSG